MPDTPTTEQRIRRALRTITETWPAMISHLAVKPVGPQVRTPPASVPPIPVHTLSTRRDVLATLAAWTKLVLDETHGKHKKPIYKHDAHTMCTYLTKWADHLAAHQAAGDAVTELEKAAQQCDTIARDIRRRRFKVGQCIGHNETPDGDKTLCTGTISALLTEEQHLLPVLTCDAPQRHTWDGSTWGDLARTPVTIADATRITRIPRSTIHHWVTTGAITPVAEGRPMLIRLSDVTWQAKIGA